MKINVIAYEEQNVNAITVQEFAEKHRLEMTVREIIDTSSAMGTIGKCFVACFDSVSEYDGEGYSPLCGKGRTVDDAISAYVNKLSRCRLRVGNKDIKKIYFKQYEPEES